MKFNLNKSIEVLERTPITLLAMLHNISLEWTNANEGGDTWCVYDIIGHLIYGEKTDWISRTEILVSNKPVKNFEAFDRFAQFEESRGKTLDQLLVEFKELREKNIEKLLLLNLTEEKFNLKGFHPDLGEVTLSQLISCWVVHDLNHLAQISRVMSKQYREEVGPWIKFLGILHK